MNSTSTPTIINGINVSALGEFASLVADNAAAGAAKFSVVTSWQGGTRSRARTAPLVLGGAVQADGFIIDVDEPPALLGAGSAPSPGDLILSALNACMTVTYVANAAAMGIKLQALTIRMHGDLDLRGFLEIDTAVNPGFDQLEYEIEVKSSASASELEALHAKVRRTSPNYHTFLRPVNLVGKLTILD